jgi:hypothetical protein
MTSICPNGHPSTSDDYCDVCGMPIDASAPQQGSAGPAVVASNLGAAGMQVCPNCETPNVADALFCEACGYDFTTGTMPRSAGAPAPDESAAPSPAPLSPPDVSAPVPAAPLTPPDGSPAPPTPLEAPSPDPLAAPAPLPSPATPAEEETQLSTAISPAVSSTAPSGAGNVSAPVTPGWVAEVWIDPAWYDAQESPDALPSPGLPTIVALRNSSVLVGRKSRSRNINPDIDCEPDTGTSRRQAQLTTDGTRWWVEDLESSNGTFVAGATDPLPEDPIPVGPKHELAPDDRIYVGAWTRIVIRQATEDELSTLG